MSALSLVVTDAGRAALVNAANTGTLPVTVAAIAVTDQAFAAAATLTALPNQLKQLVTFAGDVVADDTIHTVIRDDSADTYSLRGFGLLLADGTLFAVYSQADPILEKSVSAMLLLATDIIFADIDAASLSFGDTSFLNPPATTEVQGVVELATDAEAIAGADVVRAVTPSGLLASLNARFGDGAPSAFVKSLLTAATALAFRVLLGIKGAALLDTGAGNGLDADLLDGQHGAYYRAYGNLTGVPATFAPSAHQHAWGDLTGVPVYATRWAAWGEVTGKPATFTPSPHSQDWSTILNVPVFTTRWAAWGEVTGKPLTFPPSPHTQAIDTITGLQSALDTKVDALGGYAGADANALTETCAVALTSPSANTPTGSWSTILNVAPLGNQNAQFQLCATFASNNNELYLRRHQAATWTDWARIWSSVNFDPDLKANLQDARFGDAAGSSIRLTTGGGTVGGVVHFYGQDGLRQGYIGVGDAAIIKLVAEGGRAWDITGAVGIHGNFTVGGTIAGTNLSGINTGDQTTITGNAGTATKLKTARTISLGGVLSGSVAFDGSGNVTIPAAIADAALSIAKTAGLQAALDAKAALAGAAFTGAVSAPSFATASSRTLKHDITDIRYGIDAVRRLRFVRYRYNRSYSLDDRLRLGIIAEEAREVVPEVVVERDAMPPHVDYDQLIPVLGRALQQAIERADAAEAALRGLAARVAALERR